MWAPSRRPCGETWPGIHGAEILAWTAFHQFRDFGVANDFIEIVRHVYYCGLRGLQPQVVGQLSRDEFCGLSLGSHLGATELYDNLEIVAAVLQL